jgi:hypothetical protein
MSAPSKSTWFLLAVALVIGLAEPYLELAWKCRNGFATSEACVWGRSYWSLSRVAGLLLVTPVSFLALWVARHVWRRRGEQ